jgi:hypothetical protein
LRSVRQPPGGFKLPGRDAHGYADRDAYDHTGCHTHTDRDPHDRADGDTDRDPHDRADGDTDRDPHDRADSHAHRGADCSAVGARLRPTVSPIRSLGARYPAAPPILRQSLSSARRSWGFDII